MKVYITKYALTGGVFVFEGETSEFRDRVRIYGKRSPSHMNESFHGDDVHLTKPSALARCEEMRTKKVKSLKKQLGKILNMKFEIKEKA